MSRLFYVNLTLALVVIYLALDAAGWRLLPSLPASNSSERVRADIEQLEPLLRATDVLRRESGSVRRYRRFLRPYLAVEDAALQAIVGAPNDDPAWLALDAQDRNVCRELGESPNALNFDLLTPENPLTVGLHFLVDQLGRELLIQTDVFTTESAKEKIAACQRVARGLGASFSDPPDLPSSFYFVDFLRSSGGSEDLVAAIDTLARHWDQVQEAYFRLDRTCSANEISICSVNEIRSLLDKEQLAITSRPESEEPKIKVSFLPTGVEASLILALSPIPLTFVTFLFVSLARRRRRLVQALRPIESAEIAAVMASHPVVPGFDPQGTHWRDPVGLTINLALGLYVALGELAPLAAEAVVLSWQRSVAPESHGGWKLLTLLCLGLTLVAYVILWQERARGPLSRIKAWRRAKK